MGDLQRRSPVQFASQPLETENRDFWRIVKRYDAEGEGPWLVDLSHKTRWDLQSGRLDALSFLGVAMPAVPGGCHLDHQFLIHRMNRTQAAIWFLGENPSPEMPAESGYTDVSEASACLAILGPRVFSIAEKLTALDFMDPVRQPPVLFQGPFSHVACQIVLLAREADGTGMLLLTCSRGYARDMADAILSAGGPHGLRPAGEDRFTSFLSRLRP